MGMENYCLEKDRPLSGGHISPMPIKSLYMDKSGMPYVVRSAYPDDADDIVSLIRTVGREEVYIANEEDYYSAEQQRRILTQLNDSVQLVLVAESQGQVFGTLEAVRGTFRKNRHVVTFGMALSEAFRGQGRGAGLIATMEEWAARGAVQKIALSVFESNERAIRFYEHHGYHKEAARPGQFVIQGRMVAEVFMAKYL